MPADSTPILIHGGTVLVQSQSSPGPCELHAGWDVLVTGRRIAYVGPRDTSRIPEGCEIVDASETIVMPGFVNAHTHVAMSLFRGYGQDLRLREWLETRIWPAEARMTREDVYWGAMLACAEMIRAGVTTFCDMYFFMDAVAEAASETGLRAALSQGMMGMTAEDRRRTWRASTDLFDAWHGAADGRIRVMLGPHAPYTCPPAFLEEVGRESARIGAPVHIHLAETREEVEDCLGMYGKSPVQIAVDSGLAGVRLLAVHCVHVTEDDITLLTSSRAAVVHCPASNMNLACGIAPVSRMVSRGVTVGLGTDGAASGSTHDMFASMRIGTLAQKHREMDPTVVPADNALWMATRGGALSMGLEDVGTIAVGMRADLICVDTLGSHFQPAHDIPACLVHCAAPGDVKMVIVDGRILKRGDELLSLDEEDVLRKTRQIAARLIPR